MATRVIVSAAATVTATPWVPLDQHLHPFAVSIGVVKEGTGDVTYTVEHTFVDVMNGGTVTSADVFDHSTVSGKTGNIDSNYAFPVAAVRLHRTAGSGAAGLRLTILQAGDR